MTQRVVRHSALAAPEAELALVAELATGHEQAVLLAERLQDELFTDALARRVARALRTIVRQGGSPSLPAVCDLLSAQEAERLVQIAGEVQYRTRDPMQLVLLLEDRAFRRHIYLRLRSLSEMLLDASVGTDEIVAHVEQMVQDASSIVSAARVVSAHEAATAAVEHLIEVDEMKREGRLVRTGLPTLDDWTGGMMPGALWVLGGRPGHGKTMLALQMALDAAMQGLSVLMFSAEMSAEQLGLRLISRVGGVDLRSVRDTGAGVPDALKRLANCALYIDDTPAVRLSDIVLRTLLLRRSLDLRLVVIDYLQLLRLPQVRGETRARQLGRATKALKHLARRADVPVLLLVQLNRRAADGVPGLADLRDSGEIEEDADVVLLLHRPDIRSEETGSAAADDPPLLVVAKNRQGRAGRIELTVQAERMLMAERAEGEEWR